MSRARKQAKEPVHPRVFGEHFLTKVKRRLEPGSILSYDSDLSPIGRSRTRIRSSSTTMIAPLATSVLILGNIFSNLLLTNSTLEEERRREISDGVLFLDNEIISEKSRSCVRTVRPSFLAVSTIVRSEESEGSISLTRIASWPCVRRKATVCGDICMSARIFMQWQSFSH